MDVDLSINKILDLISLVAWVLFALLVVIFLVQTTRRRGLRYALLGLFSFQLLIPLLIVVALNLFAASLVFVNPQEVAVVLSIVESRGIRDQPLRSGLHWIIPLAEKAVRYPIYWQTYTMSNKPLEGPVLGDDSIAARTSDGQEVKLDCSIIFRIDPEQVIRVHIDWQDRYVNDLVRPAARGIVRTLVSKYSVDEVNSEKRADLEKSLNEKMRAALEDKGFILDQFLLRNIAFSPQYATAVEEKQVALQQAIQKGHEADQIRQLAAGQADQIKIMAEAQAEATLVKAQAEARALNMIGEALARRPDLITYQYVNKLAPGIKVMLVPNNVPYILPLPTLGPEEMTTQPLTTTETLSPPQELSPTEMISPTQILSPTVAPGGTPTPTAQPGG
jgi:regulator of protease activity HflC (stomatin/prohibitin superfamily)